MVLVCHVTLEDHVIKWSSDFMSESPSRSWLATVGTVVVEIK